jgi:prepilin-type N-terminal cleavage/methylation domain-containing protein
MKFKKSNQAGLTLVEVLIAVLILLPFFTVGMQIFTKCMETSDIAKNSSLAVTGIKSRMSAIENTPYNQISGMYNNTTFTIAGLNGIGVTYVDTSANHLIVTMSFSWKERRGRIIGEDKNLNGIWNTGEDTITTNNRLDSIAQISTQIYSM